MTCKGFIDLSEVVSVVSVMPLKNVQGVPKKADDDAFFEVSSLPALHHPPTQIIRVLTYTGTAACRD